MQSSGEPLKRWDVDVDKFVVVGTDETVHFIGFIIVRDRCTRGSLAHTDDFVLETFQVLCMVGGT